MKLILWLFAVSSGVYLPSVERCQRDGKGPVGDPVVEQASHDADTPVGITLREAERVRGVVVVECDLAGMTGILLPLFQPVQALLQRGVADGFGITLYILEMFLIRNFHNSCILSVRHVRLREPVFLFLTCPAVPCPYRNKVWRKKIPQRSEDDFLSANPGGARPCTVREARGYLCWWEIK